MVGGNPFGARLGVEDGQGNATAAGKKLAGA